MASLVIAGFNFINFFINALEVNGFLDRYFTTSSFVIVSAVGSTLTTSSFGFLVDTLANGDPSLLIPLLLLCPASPSVFITTSNIMLLS